MIVAEIITVISAVRVTCVTVPCPMVETPSWSNCRCDVGTLHKYQMKHSGISTNEGISHRADQRMISVFNRGCLYPSIRAAVMSAKMPASEIVPSVRKTRLGQ